MSNENVFDEEEELVDFRFYLWHESSKAWKVSEEPVASTAFWLPKSRCYSTDPDMRDCGLKLIDIAVPMWLCLKKALV